MGMGMLLTISSLAMAEDFPLVLSGSRLYQPLPESPNAMTVINQDMIIASGFLKIADLFKLVPSMYVSYYRGSEPIVSFYGVYDHFSRRMGNPPIISILGFNRSLQHGR
jgi:iron complex outermembrane receptor protein